MSRLFPRSPIRLPESRVGAFAIEHTVFHPGYVSVLDMREAFMTGRKPIQARIRKPLRVHALVEGGSIKTGSVWMTDEPRELRQASDWLRTIRPIGKRLLVGGLGLGIVATWLSRLKNIVDVVEIRPEVVSLVRPHQRGYRVIVADILAFVRSARSWPWDACFLDTWQGTGENCWWTEVMPLRRAIANRFGPVLVHCWAEDMMMGQVARAFHFANASTIKKMGMLIATAEPHGATDDGFQRTEIKVHHGRHWHYKAFPPEMTVDDTCHFLQRVGLPDWERRWGKMVDEGAQ